VPVFGSVDSTKLGAQLKVLASADAASVSKMVFFLKAVRGCGLVCVWVLCSAVAAVWKASCVPQSRGTKA
jgi:hypothetical protein